MTTVKNKVVNNENLSDISSGLSAFNNIWSELNNIASDNPKEAVRSCFLLMTDVVDIFHKSRVGSIVNNASQTAAMGYRLKDNFNKFNQEIESNKGYVTKVTVVDIVADASAIFSLAITITKFSPLGFALNMVSEFATAVSNAMNSSGNNEGMIHVDDIATFVTDAAFAVIVGHVQAAVELIATLESFIPDDYEAWEQGPHEIIGDLEQNYIRAEDIIKERAKGVFKDEHGEEYEFKYGSPYSSQAEADAALEAAFEAEYADKVADRPATIFGLGGADTIIGTELQDDHIHGGDGDDTVYGLGGDDFILGGDDNDTIYGDSGEGGGLIGLLERTGNDKIIGGLGSDTAYGGGGDDIILLAEGRINAGLEEIKADSHNDTEVNTAFGGEGDDTIYGTGGKDTITTGTSSESSDDGSVNHAYGFAGDDTLIGQAGQDTLDGGIDNDTLIGGGGDDTLLGSSGNDTLYGDSQDENDDFLGFGETKGNDIIIGGIGSDTAYGGRGNDTIILGEGEKSDSKGTLESKAKSDTERNIAFGGEGNDTIYGTDGRDNIIMGRQDEDSDEGTTNYGYGFGGNDELVGLAGKDYLYGGKGDDNLFGGKGDDELVGGGDNDTLYGEDGIDLLEGGDGNDTLHGGEGNDVLDGGNDVDTLYGDRGDDTIQGGRGVDTLYGGEGNDNLYGGHKLSQGRDSNAQNVIYGEAGNDKLYGSGRLEGGTDYDTYKAFDTAVVNDIDGEGILYYENKHLHGAHMKYKSDNLAPPPSLDFSKDGYNINDKSTARLQEISRTEKSVRYLVTGDNNFKYDGLTTEALDSGELGVKFYVTVYKEIPPPPPPFTPPSTPPTRSDPLTLDLDHDGQINTVSIGSNIKFDLDGNDFAENISWVAPQDGFVVLDVNNNGKIDNGGELFGTDTLLDTEGTKAADGFLALAQYDLNSDDLIDSEDSIFTQLKIWQDKNQDGISQEDELATLAELGITSISLNNEFIEVTDSNNVIHTHRGGFTQLVQEGAELTIKTGIAETLLFEVDTSNTVWLGATEDETGVSNDILDLPDFAGYGSATSLHLAMANDPTGMLKELVKQFATTAPEDQLALTHQILLHWTDNQDISKDVTTYSQEGMSKQEFEILKTLWGKEQEWNNWPPHHSAARELEGHYQKVLASAYSQLLIQTTERDWIDLVDFIDEKIFRATNYQTTGAHLANIPPPTTKTYEDYPSEDAYNTGTVKVFAWQLSGHIWHADFSLVIERLVSLLSQDKQLGQAEIEKFHVIIEGLDPNNSVLNDEFLEQFSLIAQQIDNVEIREAVLEAIYSLDDTIKGTSDNDEIATWGGDDTISGNAGNDTLDGGTGNDYLDGGTGNDTLDGGEGNDHLEGGAGNDTYLFKRGDGTDTIYSYENNVNKVDSIEFDASVTAEDINIYRQGNHLVIQYSEDDQITVENYFDTNGASSYRIDQIKLADGTVWDVDYIKEQVLQASDSNDTIQGYSSADTLLGLGGDDTIIGNAGNDVLNGGIGNDRLEGGAGNDTYLFKRGDGTDTIYSYENNVNKVDSIEFDASVTAEDINIHRQGNHLVIQYSEDDQITVENYFDTNGASSYRIDQIKLADGTVWDVDYIKEQVLQASDSNDTIQGYSSADTLLGLGGDDTIIGNAGNDVLNGGIGNDVLDGGTGNDRLDGGTGNDRLEGGAGNDTYLFKRGDGTDTIYSYENNVNKVDSIEFDASVTAEDINIYRQGNHLVIQYSEDDQITVENYFDTNGASSYRIDQIKLADGTVWDVDYIKEQALQASVSEGDDLIQGYSSADTLLGLGGDDTIIGNAGNDVLNGGIGNDRLEGGAGNDRLDGGTGNDYLDGGTGNDTLDGGEGNDHLEGGAGNDTYLFKRGDGTDTIYSYENNVNKVDSIEFDASVTAEDINIHRQGNHLVIQYSEDDQITVENYFDTNGASSYRIDQIKLADGTVWDVDYIKEQVLQASDSNDTIQGYSSADTLLGLGGDDTIIGNAGNDVLNGGIGNDVLDGGTGNDRLDGGEGNDQFYGGAGNDILNGGIGNDRLEGGAGNDTYLFKRGDGTDTIYSYENNVNKVDSIEFDASVTAEDINIHRQGNHLVIQYSEDDQITVENYFDTNGASSYRIDQIKLADGTVWDVDYIKEQVLQASDSNDTIQGYSSADTLLGLGGDDTIIGNAGNDVLNGGIGNDVLDGGTGNDRLDGGEGNDQFYGGAGNDILDGGTGNDRLEGGAGNDTYLFKRGDGTDTIYSYENNVNKVDSIEFDASVTAEDINIYRQGNHLVIQYSEDDQITVENYFDTNGASSYRIDQIKLADGTVWDVDYIKEQVLQASDSNDTIQGYSSADTLLGLGGDDTIIGNAGNDVLNGGIGNDVLDGGTGNDTYIFSEDWGQDTIYERNNEVNSIKLEGIDPESLNLYRDGNSLVIEQLGTENSITIIDQFNDLKETTEVTKVQTIIFDNDVVWDTTTVKEQSVIGTDTDETIYGFADADVMEGGLGNDTLYGQDGNDVLNGGIGNDVLDGGAGNDTYIFSGDWGQDTIYERNNEVNSIKLEGIDPESLNLYRDGNSLVIEQLGTENSITIIDQFNDLKETTEVTKVQTIIFDNDVVWDTTTVKEQSVIGTDTDETIYGFADADVMEGGLGNDTLYGQDGNDVLNGGIGNDVLDGGAGNDTYIFSGDWGQDTIYERNNEVNSIKLEGIDPESLNLYRDGNSLVIEQLGTENSITIIDQFNDLKETTEVTKVQTIIFDNDVVWDTTTVKEQSVIGTDTDETIYGFADADVMEGGLGNDTLYGQDGNDTLDGGEGNDRLDGGAGADTMIGGLGDDTYYLDTPEDKVVENANAGNDSIIATYDYILTDENLENAEITGEAISVTGNRQNNTLVGNANNNILDGNIGQDVMIGKEGNDTYHIDNAQDKVTEIFGEGNDSIISTVNYELSDSVSIENLTITGGAISLAGNELDNSLYGNELDNTLFGRAGHDMLDGGLGIDTTIGGTGNDTYYIDSTDDIVVENIQEGYDSVVASADYTLSANIEGLTLVGSAISAIGNEENNNIQGNELNNYLDGKLGADIMSGGAGDDYYVVDKYDSLDTSTGSINILHDGDQVVEGQLRYGYVQGDTGGNDTVEQWDDHRFYRQDDMGNWSDTGSYHHLQNNIENLILKGDAKTAFGNELDNVITLNEQSNFVNGLGGNDTIIYQKGGGQDTISVTDNVEATDTLVIQGYAQEEAFFTREQDSLMIRFAGSDEHIWIADYFKEAVADTQLNQPGVDFLPVNDVDSVSLSDDTLVLLSDSPNGEGNLDSEMPLGEPSSDDLFINDQPIPMIDNKIDRIIFDNNGEQVVLTQQDIDAAIIDRADNHAPTVNKHAQAITINDDEALNVQFDADTIVDADAWDSSLSYRITLASQNADGSYQDIPDWLNFDADTRTLTGSPTVDSIGNYSFILWAGDLFGTSAGTYLTLTVNSSQPVDVPVETSPDNVVEGTDSSEQLLGTNGNDLINGYLGDDQIFGFAGNDTLNGGAGNDYLAGGNGSGTNSGNDIINGGAGDDTLSGEDGNDILNGGAGNDSYVYKANQGIDIINNAGGGTDVIFFQQIDKTQLTYHKEGSNLIILVDGDLNQQVKVTDHFLSSGQAIDYIVASDGMMVSAQKIAGQLTALPESDNTDTGGNGDDTTTPSTPTTPEEPADNVDLSGDNTIKDTAGNDRLEGGRGNDTYIYTAGKDTIVDTHGIDEIIFSNGITFNQVGSGLMSSGNDLILRVNGDANNQVTIKDYFSNGDRIIETISFETGGSISHEQIFGLFGKAIPEATPIDNITPNAPNDNAGADIIGTDGDDQLQGTEVDNRLQGLIGDDRLDGELGNDILIGGIGNDFLKGNAGNDLYYFEAGFGQDIIDNKGGGIDNIYFDGVGFNDIASGLMRSNDDLILKVSGTTDQLTIADFFEGGESAVGNISFASGGSISADQIFGAYGISNPNPTNASSAQHQSTLGSMLDMMQQFDENSMNNGYGDVI